MKITDKTEETLLDPVVKRGDIIKRQHALFGTDYYLVTTSSSEHGGDSLISLKKGSKYTQRHIPVDSSLQYYINTVFIEGSESNITHITAEKAELVIGG